MRYPVDHIRNNAGMVYGPGSQAIEENRLGCGNHQSVKQGIAGNLAFQGGMDVGDHDIKNRQHTPAAI